MKRGGGDQIDSSLPEKTTLKNPSLTSVKAVKELPQKFSKNFIRLINHCPG